MIQKYANLTFTAINASYTKNGKQHSLSLKSDFSAMNIRKDGEGLYRFEILNKDGSKVLRTINNAQNAEINEITKNSGVTLYDDISVKINSIDGENGVFGAKLDLMDSSSATAKTVKYARIYFNPETKNPKRAFYADSIEKTDIQNIFDKVLNISYAEKLSITPQKEKGRLTIAAEEMRVNGTNIDFTI
jgi:hypothetical protein